MYITKSYFKSIKMHPKEIIVHISETSEKINVMFQKNHFCYRGLS
jgi:hypothetical protein